MPIQCPLDVLDISQTEFDEIDRHVMRAAYDSQNELGRLCKERAHENDRITATSQGRPLSADKRIETSLHGHSRIT